MTFGKSSATRLVKCLWADRISLIRALTAVSGINAANQYTFNPQSPYPDAPGTLFISQINVTGEAIGGLKVGDNGMVAYKNAVCELIYTSLPYNYGNLNIESMDYSVEEMSIPTTDGQPAFFYSKGGNPDFTAPVTSEVIPAIRVSTMTFVIQQFYTPVLPINTVTAIIGQVNGGTFNVQAPQNVSNYATGSFDKETLLFEGAKSNRRIALASDGTSMSDMSFTFRYNPQGWNNRIKPGGNPIWQRIVDKNGNPPFKSDGGNFASLGIFNNQGLAGTSNGLGGNQ